MKNLSKIVLGLLVGLLLSCAGAPPMTDLTIADIASFRTVAYTDPTEHEVAWILIPEVPNMWTYMTFTVIEFNGNPVNWIKRDVIAVPANQFHTFKVGIKNTRNEKIMKKTFTVSSKVLHPNSYHQFGNIDVMLGVQSVRLNDVSDVVNSGRNFIYYSIFSRAENDFGITRLTDAWEGRIYPGIPLGFNYGLHNPSIPGNTVALVLFEGVIVHSFDNQDVSNSWGGIPRIRTVMIPEGKHSLLVDYIEIAELSKLKSDGSTLGGIVALASQIDDLRRQARARRNTLLEINVEYLFSAGAEYHLSAIQDRGTRGKPMVLQVLPYRDAPASHRAEIFR